MSIIDSIISDGLGFYGSPEEFIREYGYDRDDVYAAWDVLDAETEDYLDARWE